jgi:hypothetical protein
MEISAVILTIIAIVGFSIMNSIMNRIRDKWLDEDFAYLRKIKEELDKLR